MINLKAQIRKSEINSEGKVKIKIRVSHQRKTRYLSTSFNVFPEQFDNNEGKVKPKKHPNAQYLNIELQKIILNYESKILSLNENIDIKSLLEVLKDDNATQDNFFTQINFYIEQLKSLNKKKTAETYTTTRNLINEFIKTDFLSFKTIDFKFLNSFEVHLAKKGSSINGIGVNMRNIRSIFNRSIDNGVMGLEYYPFRRFKIKKEKNNKTKPYIRANQNY